MDRLFKGHDDYLTYKGQIKAWGTKKLDKLGYAGKEAQDWLDKRQEWYQIAKAQFLAYRKWVTGVAGGEKEMAEIAKSYPDPDKNSPAEYKGNLRRARLTVEFFRAAYAESYEKGKVLAADEMGPMFTKAWKAAGRKGLAPGEKPKVGKKYIFKDKSYIFKGYDKEGKENWKAMK